MAVDIETIGVAFETSGLVKGTAALKEAERAAHNTANAADKLTKSASTTSERMSALATSARLLAGGVVALAATQTLLQVVRVQREFDVLNSSLRTVTGSSAAAEKEMAWIKDFAKETPFGLAQATQGFVKMKALGLDPTKASLTSFGNTASAMGKDLNQMVEAVADASTGEFERLKEFGIKASKQGDQVKLTFQGVTTTVGNSAREITGYLEDLGKNEFAGAMALRAATLDGAIASLGDTWDELYRTISNAGVGSLIQDSVMTSNAVIEDAITLINAMTGDIDANNQKSGVMKSVQEGIATVFETVAVVAANVKYVIGGIGNELGGLAAQAWQIVQGNFSGAAAIRRSMVSDAATARAEIDATTARVLGARKDATAAAEVNAQASARLARQGVVDASALVDAHAKAAGGVTKLTEAQKEAAKALEFYTDLMDQASGYSKTYAKDQNMLALALKTGAIKSYDDYVVAVKKLMSLQPGAIAAEKALEAATKDRVAATVRSINAELDAYYKMRDAIDDVNKSLNDLAHANASEADALVFEAGLMGQNATERSKAIEQYKILAKYKAEAAKITDSIADPAVRASMLASLAVQQQQAIDNAARAVDISAWNSTFDRINESLTDALIAAGRDGGSELRSVLEQELLAKPFKIILQGALQSTAQSLTNAAVGGSALSSATGGLSTLLGSSSMGALDIAGFSVPQIGLALAAISLLSNIGGNFVSASDSGRARVDYSASGVGGSAYSTTGDASEIASAYTNVGMLAQSYYKTASSLGITANQATFEYGTNTGREGSNPMTVIGANIGSAGYSSGEVSSSDTAGLQLAASRAVLTALQASQLPGYLSGVFNGLTAGSATQDQINTALAYAQSLKTVRDALLETRTPLEVLQANVNTAFATLGTSADSFKTDFVAAIDAGISSDALAQWQSLGTALDTLATDAAATAKAATEAAAALLKTNQGWQDQLDVLTGQRSQTQVDRYNALTAVTDASTRALMKQVYAQQDIAAATQATTTSFAAIAASVMGISTSVSDSIFGMQYGMADATGKYNMLDVKAAGINDKMLGSTDINTIASLAASQIELLNQSWALLDPTQQQATYLQFEDKLNKIDEYVVSKGADALGLQEAADRRTADTISAAVEKAVEKAMAASASALQAAAEKADRPIVVESRVTVSAPAGSEVSIT